jgi:hypothetical protein
MSAGSKKRYEVRISYQGVSTYLIDADSEEKAAELARERYRRGGPEDATGSEYEDIVGVVVGLVPPAGLPVPGRMYLVEYDETYSGGDYHSVGITVMVSCPGDDGIALAFKRQTGVDPVHIVHYRRAAGDEEEDFSSRRVGSAHAEDVIGGRARCAVCGWIDEADPKDPTVRAWHGDSFGDEVSSATAAPSEDMPNPPQVGKPRGSG